jgi:hypothetical protein
MALNLNSYRIASTLPLIAIGLALANWNVKPSAAWAWTAVIVISVVMVAVQRFWQLALSRSPGNAALVRSVASVANGVVFGALMMIVPLALILAHAYGLVDDPDSGMRRTIMVIVGAYLAVTGNAIPRLLPPTSSLPFNGARVQAFQRLAGWTWVLCGLGFAIAALALPIDMAAPVSMTLVAIAIIVTIVELLRLRNPRPQNQKYVGIGVGIGLGLCFGAVLGTAMQNVGVGVAFGVAIGVAFSLIFGGAPLPREKGKTRTDPQPLGLDHNRQAADGRDGEPRRVRR